MKCLIKGTLIILFFSFLHVLSAISQQVTQVNDTISLTVIKEDSAKDAVAADTVKSDKSGTKGVLGDAVETLKNPPIEKVISISKVIWSVIIIFVGYLFLLIISRILHTIAERSVRYRVSLKRLIPIIKVIIWILIIYTIIQGVLKPPFATVIAFFTSIGVAVGFAAQDLLKNIFGGFVILFDRPFQLGDKIDTGKYYGEVVKIGLRSTKIVTPDDSTVTIPNSEVMSQQISNANTGESNCQVVAEIYLPIDIDTEKVRKIALEAARISKYVFLDKPVVALFVNEVKERRSYLKLRLKAYVYDLRYEFIFKSDMTEIVLRELLNSGLIKPEDLL